MLKNDHLRRCPSLLLVRRSVATPPRRFSGALHLDIFEHELEQWCKDKLFMPRNCNHAR